MAKPLQHGPRPRFTIRRRNLSDDWRFPGGWAWVLRDAQRPHYLGRFRTQREALAETMAARFGCTRNYALWLLDGEEARARRLREQGTPNLIVAGIPEHDFIEAVSASHDGSNYVEEPTA